ncbi:MAG: DUF4435 domain-containing protein [Prevotella sp.]|nr:DUF4435 domain-containing protein [Bacteroides sp.]MCM1367109.1 DUF4435 domain-containing protein [Prevotella sp.]MCM1437429.1 DUF4435 domain-containing protein [Prevotella sp.]
MTDFLLPPHVNGKTPPGLPDSKQITIVGANGAGKTRFMKELMKRCPGKAYCLSALGASFPERSQSKLPGSIDELYDKAIKSQPYLRSDAISEIDKLAYMLFTDEFEYLLSLKVNEFEPGKRVVLKPTKLDKLRQLWEKIFPGNHILRHTGKLMFATDSGENIITAGTLSEGEKAVLYYIAAVLYAMPDAVIFIDSPSLFLHPSILNTLWNAIEDLRPDCKFVYNTVDVDFVNSRTENVAVWIKSFDVHRNMWDYEIFDSGKLSDDLFIDLIGTRRPVLFIEGDIMHSIDSKLYTLVFPEYTVRPLGSCDKVIESTRTFNDLKPMHHLDSHGLVDRDRRTSVEVEYLRRKEIYVPDVAEVENIFLLEEVIRVMSRRRGKDPDKIFKKVKQSVMGLFKKQFDAQALQHVRHKVKRDVECKIDARFSCISAMEIHLRTLIDKLKPREHYNTLRREFAAMLSTGDYAGVLRVFNYKPMLSECNVAQLLGYPNKDAYIAAVLGVLKGTGKDSRRLRAAIKFCFGLDLENNPVKPGDKPEISEDDSTVSEDENLERQIRQSRRAGKKYHRGRKL